ncbi:A24 family peptidase [cf. Phormidesmis sp. LEGE 11477]|uniref:prepilin peptidase n=1 Tax=cf. Phormidesmis sp. LEGE 11477 TaxID=1828680 RepID=UPI0018815B8B|nr:prepilin peptidase [cf. Phormidesmis sp. LEGE 11477]
MDSTALLIVFFLGAAVGSFLNVVVYRLPAGLSLLYPPSRCPKCEKRLKPYDNVPIFGWLWLLGRCRSCKLPIAARYPLVEFVTGCLFVSVFARFGITWQTPCYWIFICWLLTLALIDLDTMTLPNSLTASGLVMGWAFQGWMSYLTSPSLLSGASGALMAFFASIFGLWLFDFVGIAGSRAFGKAAMGGGDSKLAAMMAAWLGWSGLLLATFLAATMGSIIGGGALALGVLGPKQHIPFGPYLALGAVLVLFYGQQLIDAYLSIFFPLGL